jgi:predicted nucleic acid-binding protein
MRVFADTSGIFAALVSNDQNHDSAKNCLTKLLEDESVIITSSYVLLECISLLQARVSVDAARQFERILRPAFQVIWISEELHERAFRRLELKNQRSLSLTDCTSFICMEEYAINQVFAFDPHFTKAGFELL